MNSKIQRRDGAPIINDDDVRIVMVGKTGAGKSATGNTILGFEAFEAKFSSGSMTQHCKKVKGLVGSRNVAVVDTPGLFDTKFSQDQTIQEIAQCIDYSAPGPHVFLVVMKLGRFTAEEKKTVEIIQEGFGNMSIKYTMLLFTGGDQLDEGQSVQDVINDSSDLKELVSKCNCHYHVFNNKAKKDPSQVAELLKKIDKVVKENGGHHYTSEMLQEAERAIEVKKQKILKKNEEKRRKEEEEVKKKYEKELQQKGWMDKAAREREINEMKSRHQQEARQQAENRGVFETVGNIFGSLFGSVGSSAFGAVGKDLDSCFIQ